MNLKPAVVGTTVVRVDMTVPVFVVVMVLVAVTVTVAILNKVLVVLKVSVPPLAVRVKVFLENLVTVDQRPTFSVSVGMMVTVLVGLMGSVLVTVSVFILATDVFPSSVRQVTLSSSAAREDTVKKGMRAAENRIVFMLKEDTEESE